MVLLSLSGIGFSIIAAPILYLAYAFYFKSLNQSALAKTCCLCVLVGLVVLQIGHYLFFSQGLEVLDEDFYRLAVFTVPPLFYFFSQAILFPDKKFAPLQLLHLVPITLVLVNQTRIIIAVSFILGFAYCTWLSTVLYRLRHMRLRFKEEFFFFSLFAVIALVVLLLGVLASFSDSRLYYYVYSNSISFSLALIVFTLLVKPDLLESINEVVQQGYVQSTLNNIDRPAVCETLQQLMEKDRLYQNEDLNLATLAGLLNLSSHQLSELINSEYGISFSRYIRRQRIEAAKSIMAREKQASILSISMEVGFKSQSNFYAAFKEEEGLSPGQYRENLKT